MKKTFLVRELKERANAALARKDAEFYNVKDAESYRQGVCFMLESVLHATGQYKGFGYIGGYKEGGPEYRRSYY